MESANFFKLLKRHRLTLVIIPLITIIVTYLLVRNLPTSYVAQTQISTGIVDASQQLLEGENTQENRIHQQFSNIIATIQMKKILNQVSYQLILHDLTSDSPFRKPSKLFNDLNPQARQHAIEVYTRLYTTHGSLLLWDKDQNGLSSVLSSMKYDVGSLSSKLVIYREENSDFIHIEYDSDNPMLSAFVVNTLVKEFITYYTYFVKENQHKAVTFLDSLLRKKRTAMDAKIDSLKSYKIKNHILNLNEQAKSLYTQIADFESRKQQAERDIAANAGAIKNIDRKFNPTNRKYFESALTQINKNIVASKQLLRALTDSYIKSNYSSIYKQQIDSVQNAVNVQINESSDQYIYSPLATKSNLVAQKINLEIAYDLAKYSLNTLDKEISRLKTRVDQLVPNEAVIQSSQNEIDVDSKEYLDILQKYNQTSMQSGFSIKLRQIDIAMPGVAQPSKKMLLVVLSGAISLAFCLIILFILFYLDNSISEPRMLANKTGLPVLGYLNMITGTTLDLRKLWDVENRNKMREFKDLLRSIRFEIDQELKDDKILAITSLGASEGKTLLAISLAYSYSIINKRVLLIDGNCDNPTISTTVQPKLFIEDFFGKNPSYNDGNISNVISVIGNKGNDITLLEIDNEKLIREKFIDLKSKYDIIIMEVPSLDTLNKAKEWMLFADKTIAVFEANQTITDSKNTYIKYLKTLGPQFSGWVFNKSVIDKGESRDN